MINPSGTGAFLSLSGRKNRELPSVRGGFRIFFTF
jgi:hypothetical protein